MPLPTEAEAAAAEAAAVAEVAEAVAVAVAAVAAVAARVVAGPVQELVPGQEQAREQEREQELAPETEPAVAAVMTLTSVHTDRRTRAASAGEYFKGAGSAGSTNTRPSLIGTCGGTRRKRAIFSGLTRLSGHTPR